MAHCSTAAARRLVVVIGCTGTGKSKLAIQLAKRFAGEVISADSMQVYQGLDIITNKVTTEEMDGVEHHLLSYLSPLTLGTTVTQFRAKALATMEDIWARDKLPILVGGTSYYIESVLWNILIDDSSKPNDPSAPTESASGYSDDGCHDQDEEESPDGILTYLAEGIPAHLCSADKTALYAELEQVDPERARRLHPHDSRRVMRSLQIWYGRGLKHSSLIAQKAESSGVRQGGTLRFPNTCVFLTKCSQKVLEQRLVDRIDKMVELGLKREIEQFHSEYYQRFVGLRDAAVEKIHGMEGLKGVFQSIGLKEFESYLALTPEERNSESGQTIFNRCCTDLSIATRVYAKKQTSRIMQSFLRMRGRQKLPVYPVDSSDIDNWDAHVRIPAESVLDEFLNNRSPITGIEPMTISSDEESDQDKNLIAKCDVCDRYIIGDRQWIVHLKSKGHRFFVKKRSRKAEAERMFAPGEEKMMSEDGVIFNQVAGGMDLVSPECPESFISSLFPTSWTS